MIIKDLEKSTAKEHLWNTKDPVAFAENKLGIKLDSWQKKYINCKGNVAIRAGRQTGKSFSQSIRAALYALLNKNTTTLIIGAVDRQSVEIFEKVKSVISQLGKSQIKGRVTMHKVELKNGSKIVALPAGRSGYGLRGYTINKLVADEAHYISEEVWTAVRPMLATTNGTMDLLSTPRGNQGFFYDVFKEESGFKTFHVSAEDCPRHSKEYLQEEKKRMTKLQYAQEYLAEFLDALQSFFPKDIIDPCIQEIIPRNRGDYYLGVDVARYGGDENAFLVLRVLTKENTEVEEIITTEMVSTMDTIRKIQELNQRFNFKMIYLDDAGVGGPVLDYLLEDPIIKRKIEGLNNARRAVLYKTKQPKRLLKEDLYGNLRRLFEMKQIKIPDNENLIRSLLSIQYEIDETTGNVKIFGRYSHITEALIRAAWSVKTKGLKIWIR